MSGKSFGSYCSRDRLLYFDGPFFNNSLSVEHKLGKTYGNANSGFG